MKKYTKLLYVSMNCLGIFFHCMRAAQLIDFIGISIRNESHYRLILLLLFRLQQIWKSSKPHIHFVGRSCAHLSFGFSFPNSPYSYVHTFQLVPLIHLFVCTLNSSFTSLPISSSLHRRSSIRLVTGPRI